MQPGGQAQRHCLALLKFSLHGLGVWHHCPSIARRGGLDVWPVEPVCCASHGGCRAASRTGP
ncbi:hypothetical protein BN2364_2872 [Alloalcanivorax xenomutans]|nr:hypothetical protein BN2364_2872 [Alloalcanivorax xenomutans]